jgi:hypothetical protein
MATKATFNMSKETKRMLATLPKDLRNIMKPIMIDAQVAFEKPAPSKKMKEADNEG